MACPADDTTEPESIPKQLTAWTDIMARVGVGAIAALVMFIALEVPCWRSLTRG